MSDFVVRKRIPTVPFVLLFSFYLENFVENESYGWNNTVWACRIKNNSSKKLKDRLVYVLKQQFSIFKQYYIYFYILFYLHVFSKNTNNVTRTTLPNGL